MQLLLTPADNTAGTKPDTVNSSPSIVARQSVSAHSPPRRYVVVAPIKYGDKVLLEVGKLMDKRGLKVTKAIQEISVKYSFVEENFRRAYYRRRIKKRPSL